MAVSLMCNEYKMRQLNCDWQVIMSFSTSRVPIMLIMLATLYPQSTRSGSIPSLETNLLKILARKIQDSEDISFRKAKLLTKAYYRMLRNNSDFPQNNYSGTSQPLEYSSLVVTSGTCVPRLQPVFQSCLSW